MSKKELKEDVYKILSRAASHICSEYRDRHNMVDWGLVEKDIYKAIDTRYPNKALE